MSKLPTLRAALQCAIDTAKEQPREVPECPAGWLARAEAAVAGPNDALVELRAREIAGAHTQYPAEFDRKAWLYELREVLLANMLARRNAPGFVKAG